MTAEEEQEKKDEESVADAGVDKPTGEELAAEAAEQAGKKPAEKPAKTAKEEPAKPMPAEGDKPAAQAMADKPADEGEGEKKERPARPRPRAAAKAEGAVAAKERPARARAARKGAAGAKERPAARGGGARRPRPKKKEEKPRELSPRQKEFVEKLKAAFGGIDWKERVNVDGELAITVPREQLLEIGQYLRDEAGLNYLRSISGVDWQDRLACVYNLVRIPLPGQEAEPAKELFRLAVHAEVSYEDAALPSVYDLWPAADYQEREVYDMFGIKFTGHPNLKTLLLPPNWQGGYPLRKDFVDKRPKRQRLVRPR